MTTDSILLYTAKVCPFAARTELALEVTGVPYKTYQIDLANKPSWYAEKINKASKVPCLVINDGAEDKFTLPESQVIVEYLADAYPTAGIFPASHPRDKARARYLVEKYMQLVTAHYLALVFRKEPSAASELLKGLAQFDELLEQNSAGPFVQGDRFGYADIHIAPFMGRILSVSRNGYFPNDPNAEQPTTPIHEALEKDPKLTRVKQWWSAVEATSAWNTVWDEEAYLTPVRQHLNKQ